jgi:inner membrane protease ATP23
VSRSFFKVEPCADAVGGGFRPPDGVVLCHNHLPRAVDVTQAMAHELIHAYDHCRAADLDWATLDHHACSEVRAASLSGDCSFANEVMRGHAGVRGQHQACARRRAALSVAMNPACVGGPREAEAAVDRVFDACFADTAPFDRIP